MGFALFLAGSRRLGISRIRLRDPPTDQGIAGIAERLILLVSRYSLGSEFYLDEEVRDCR